MQRAALELLAAGDARVQADEVDVRLGQPQARVVRAEAADLSCGPHGRDHVAHARDEIAARRGLGTRRLEGMRKVEELFVQSQQR